jgi:hypothetical protein
MVSEPQYHKIIFLNGPPRCGKDTAKRFILGEFAGKVRAYDMFRPIAWAFQGLFDIKPDAWARNYETWKTEGNAEFLGYNLRPLMISFAEEWVKPTFGQDAFGKLALRWLTGPTSCSMTIVSSVGFFDEVQPIVERFGPENCLLIQLSKDGCTYDGDSRSYVELDNVTTVQLNNRYDLEMYKVQVIKAVKDWLYGDDANKNA